MQLQIFKKEVCIVVSIDHECVLCHINQSDILCPCLQVYSWLTVQIGTEFSRGVSGGERKRTSIGMELIIEPQVLFLDEPTTGLDARTAVSVVQLLRQ